MKTLLIQFIQCHDGSINRMLHVVGIATLGYGVWQKSLLLLVAGSCIQEFGHIYQYYKTGELRDNPMRCLKPQSVFVYPIFIGLIIYVLS